LRQPLVLADDFISETGKGIKCNVNGHTIHIGNRRWLTANDIEISPGTFDAMEYLEERGQTSIVLSVDGRSEAVIGLIDKAKDEATLAVNVLQKSMGIKVYMLTGDNLRTARVVADEVGIPVDHVIADVLPEGKVECIKKLQDEGHRVAMIGDGINDSPALAQADVGMAIGAGTDVAIETAEVVLVNSKLTDVITAIDLARTIYFRIRLNFVWALGYNALAIPVASGMLYPLTNKALPPFVAAIAMIFSSISVLLSSLLLNRYKPPRFDKQYGRVLRQGKLDLESVSVISNGTEIAVPIQCESMKNGNRCCCDPGKCACSNYDCNLDSNSSPSDNFYPGCHGRWDKACSCPPPCKCGLRCLSSM